METVFVSHPCSENRELNLKRVEKICKEIEKEGYLPVSPLHLFSFVEEETPEMREKILDLCYRTIELCDIVQFNKYDNELSPGQVLEYNFTKDFFPEKIEIIER